MAFSTPVFKTKEQYDALTASFASIPTQSKTGTPDAGINRIVLKGWTSDSVLAFAITCKANSYYTISVEPATEANPSPKALSLTMATNSAMSDVTTYMTVDTGSDNNKDSDWTITFDVMANNKSTGKWIFRKGGSGDPS
jgi:hypothetical protein